MTPASGRPAATSNLAGMVLGLTTALAALYIWTSGQGLPELVASHFGPSGAANGFMPRGYYLGIMMVIVVLLPLLLTVVMGPLLRMPNARINLPDRGYWLAPDRRDATIEVLLGYMRIFAGSLVLFLCYVHGLVVRANQAAPAMLNNTLMVRALGVFFFFAIIWIVLLRRRFRT